MNNYLGNRNLQSFSCCGGRTSCVHRLAATSAPRDVDGFDGEALGEIAHARKLDGSVLGGRRSFLSAAGLMGFAGLVPLSGCASTGDGAVATPVMAAPIGRVHVVESNDKTVRVGAMDPNASPVAEIESGDLVHYPNTWVNWANQAKYGMSFEEREPIRKRFAAGPYSLIGPVAVRGAEPGDWIECRMVKLRPIEWGWNSAPLGVGALPTEFKKPYLQYFKFDDARTHADFKNGISYPLRPTQGVVAAMPAGDKPVSGILSGPYGGNIVVGELTEGGSIFVPVQRAGGLVWTGDSHAVQGDGVVNQTAIETAMEDMQIQYVLHKRSPLKNVLVETPTHWILLGYGDSIETALTASLLNTIDWLSQAARIGRDDAYSVISVAGSVRVTQYSHQTNTVYTNVPSKGIHTLIPKNIFTPEMAAAVSRATRTNS